MMELRDIAVVGLLGICSIEDIWKRKVHLCVVCAFAVSGMAMQLYDGGMKTLDIAGGVGVGLILYIVSVASRQRIGKGDALVLLATGIYIGFWRNIALLWGGSLLAGMAGLGMFFFQGKTKQYEMPFIPFLLAAYLLLKMLQMTGGSVG